MQNLRVGQYSFEQTEDFEYLGINVNQINDMYSYKN